MKSEALFKLKYKWYRLTHWEFWPMWAIYVPCTFYYIWISIKSQSFGFFKAVNPAILHGGMTLEDKNFVNRLFPQKYRAHSFFLNEKTSTEKAIGIMKNNDLEFPIILKPNNGCRGRNVELIAEQKRLENYLIENNSEDLLLEEYIDFPNEIGVFYVRFPNKEKGFISGIVQKKGIEVFGDGKKTLKELVKYNLRYHRFYPEIFGNSDISENYIPKQNEKILLSSIGNHARGATFYDASDRISSKLEELFNTICSQVNEIYYGRFDIKFNTWEELENGKNFKIIEFNGAASEPTYIYDPKNSYLFALKEIAKHWNYMYQIAKINKSKGYCFTNIKECWAMLANFLNLPLIKPTPKISSLKTSS